MNRKQIVVLYLGSFRFIFSREKNLKMRKQRRCKRASAQHFCALVCRPFYKASDSMLAYVLRLFSMSLGVRYGISQGAFAARQREKKKKRKRKNKRTNEKQQERYRFVFSSLVFKADASNHALDYLSNCT